ncbi:hypothetical protein VKT23_002158 [Stygiomarasmius scandens]|uniref:alpha-1,2-Mannosidase n=1 Tax=Marasmiellus scandens TaxID=2682957 RepID=A0ABR1K2H1_9AGAR
MKWGRYLPESLAVLVIVALEGIDWVHSTLLSDPVPKPTPWNAERKLAARERTRDLWYHGFNSYMRYAFPLDELTPLSCSGQGPNWSNPAHISVNDVAGNFSLTLIDVLDTFVVLNDPKGFESAVRNVIDWVSFDVNTKPQVFETTIRVLGGLLSGHIFANQTGPFHLPWYRGELLDLATDLGNRLMTAFKTPTGLPFARVNLRHGLMKGESLDTCTAGAGSLILEFATLGRLTGDERFEKAAYKAFFALWNRKSDIGLVGNTINAWTGDWTSPEITGIGAGIDSFYEYALKWYVMSGEVEFLDVWDDAYASIMRYSRSMDGFWYKLVNMRSGDAAYNTVDSLSAFWPGLQVLAGDVQSAIKLHLLYYNLWRRHSGLPEVYDTSFKLATSHSYPLRPEFIESTWYLYRATRDPFYLDVGERVLSDLITRAKVDCGLAGIEDLRTNKRDDRMESFALSETLKYLFLLFDEENPLHKDDSNYVFTTEGHLLTLGREHLKPISQARRKLRKLETHQCPAYQPFTLSPDKESGLVQGIRGRADIDYTRELVALDPSDYDSMYWSPNGWCERPKMELFSYDFVLSPHGKTSKEDLSPSLIKLAPVRDGFIINNVTGVRTHIVRRLDGKGYDIRKVGHYTVRPGQTVYINDTALFPDTSMLEQQLEDVRLPFDVQLRLYVDIVDPMFNTVEITDTINDMEITVTGYSALFGADLSRQDHEKPIRFSGLSPVYRDEDNLFGCSPFAKSYQDGVLIVSRGECTFLQKLIMARDAGAAGVLVIGDDNTFLNPTADPAELDVAGDISDVAIVVLPLQAGQLVEQLLVSVDESGLGQLMLSLEHERQPAVGDSGDLPDQTPTRTEAEKEVHRILYLNGLPLLNTRLLV